MKTLIIRAAGTNCDLETEHALKTAGFETTTRHINEIIKGKKNLTEYSFLVIPGGFSAGDYLGSGKVFANKLVKIKEEINEFIAKGNLILGICNGFQVLTKTGLLPDNDWEQKVSLISNDPAGFQCRWVNLKVQESKSIFTQGIEELFVPIAHGEGRFVAKNKEVLDKLNNEKQIPFTYEKNPNGSINSIAGICDKTGRIMGMMPHPERNLDSINSPNAKNYNEEGEGLKIFRNAFNYLKK